MWIFFGNVALRLELVFQHDHACFYIIPVLSRDVEVQESLKAIFSHHGA